MIYYVRLFLIAAVSISSLTACVTTPSDFEEPSLTVTSFTPKNSDSISPRFEIVLHITNPNRDPLELVGISYTIELEGNKVMSGVANDLPTIEPYGETDVKLEATVNLFGGFQVLTGLMHEHKEHIEYEFNAKLDIGAFKPMIRVTQKGQL
jgi:LEA14-like dessication related protein